MPWEVKGYSGGCGERGDEIKGKRREREESVRWRAMRIISEQIGKN